MTWSPAWGCPAGRSNASGRRLPVPKCNSSFHPPLRVGSAWWSMAPDCPCPRWPRRSWPTSLSNSGPSRSAPFAGALRRGAHASGPRRAAHHHVSGQGDRPRSPRRVRGGRALAPGVSVDTAGVRMISTPSADFARQYRGRLAYDPGFCPSLAERERGSDVAHARADEAQRSTRAGLALAAPLKRS